MPTGKQEDIMLTVNGKQMTMAEYGQLRRDVLAGKTSIADDGSFVVKSDTTAIKTDTGYDAIAEQNERYDAVLGIDRQSPVGNDKSQTVSTETTDFENTTSAYTEDRFSTNARTHDKRNELLQFPDDLATDGKNRYWTKITVYEVQYNAEKDEAGANSKIKVYRKGKAVESAGFVDGAVMSSRKGAYDKGKSSTLGSEYANNYVMTNLTIALPMPNNDPQWEFMLNWGDQANWGWGGAIMDLLGNAFKLNDWKSAEKDIKDLWERVRKDLAQKLPIAGQYIKGSQKEFINDRAELLFNGFGDTRRPTFNWTLFPKNQKESERLLDIIETLKSLVLPALKQTPDKQGNKNVLMFPALFEICFMNGDQENASMPRFGPVAVQSFKVIAIQDKWQAHKDGTPIGYQIDMSGVELVQPFRDNLEDDNKSMYIR